MSWAQPGSSFAGLAYGDSYSYSYLGLDGHRWPHLHVWSLCWGCWIFFVCVMSLFTWFLIFKGAKQCLLAKRRFQGPKRIYPIDKRRLQDHPRFKRKGGWSHFLWKDQQHQKKKVKWHFNPPQSPQSAHWIFSKAEWCYTMKDSIVVKSEDIGAWQLMKDNNM